jgi:hypothetical protein
MRSRFAISARRPFGMGGSGSALDAVTKRFGSRQLAYFFPFWGNPMLFCSRKMDDFALRAPRTCDGLWAGDRHAEQA